MTTSQTRQDNPDRIFLALSILGFCFQVGLSLYDPGEYGRVAHQPSFFLFSGIALFILLTKLPPKASAIADFLRLLLVAVMVTAALSDSWPKVVRFFRQQSWLFWALATPGSGVAHSRLFFCYQN